MTVPLIIFSKLKYDVNQYDTFLIHKEKKSKEHFLDYTFLFYFYNKQVIEELSCIYLGKQFLFTR